MAGQLFPHFIGIGAQRAATTWAFNCLQEHPQICMPAVKEVHYFDENYERGSAWYAAHFAECPPGAIRGEITPNYLDVPAAAERIARDCPDVRLFAILREPVSRAISSYQLLGHRFSEKSFDEACQPGKYLVDLGLYAKHLKRFYEYFERERIRVWLYDDVRKDPQTVLREFYQYLGVDSDFVPQAIDARSNAVVFPRTQRFLERCGLTGAINLVKQTPLVEPIKAIARKRGPSTSSPVVENDMQRYKGFFRDDILELQDLIDRDLSHWLSY